MPYNYRRTNRSGRRSYRRGVKRSYSSRFQGGSRFPWRPVQSRNLAFYAGQLTKNHDVYTSISAGAAGYDAISFSMVTAINPSSTAPAELTGTRDGVLVKPLEFSLRGNLSWTDAGSCQMVRLIVFQWMQDTGLAAPGYAQILDTSAGPAHMMINPPSTSDLTSHCKILYDAVFAPPLTREGAHTATYVPVNVQIRSGMNAIRFHQGSTSGRGHIYVMYWGAALAASAVVPSFQFFTRTRFVDF